MYDTYAKSIGAYMRDKEPPTGQQTAGLETSRSVLLVSTGLVVGMV